MEIKCPYCSREIDPQNVNIEADSAMCRWCQRLFAPSSLTQVAPAVDVDWDNPPPGVQVTRLGRKTVITASTRSAWALLGVPFLLLWTAGVIGKIYLRSEPPSLYETLIGIVFLSFSVILWVSELMLVVGRVEIRLEPGRGEVFSGIGPIGWRRAFDPGEVHHVREEIGGRRGTYRVFVLEGKERLRFGGLLLNDQRRYFVLQALKRALHELR